MKFFNILGTMSGTSFDGINIVYVNTDGSEFLKSIACGYVKYPKIIIDELHHIHHDSKFFDVLKIEKSITRFYADVINNFIEDHKLHLPDFIAFHGQTVFHSPEDGITSQIGDGALLATLCDIDVISDFRRGDMAKGGQGAPIVPIYHKFLTSNVSKPVALINIGGIANITFILNDGHIMAADSGPGCGLIDKWIFTHDSTLLYDPGGEIASNGVIHNDILNKLLSNQYFYIVGPKSLDKNSFFVDDLLSGLSIEDGAATLVEFTALTIKKAFEVNKHDEKISKIFLCGGGKNNVFLRKRIENAFNFSVDIFDVKELGHDAEYIEAEAMAYIAARSLNGLDFTFPQTTNVRSAQHLVCMHSRSFKYKS